MPQDNSDPALFSLFQIGNSIQHLNKRSERVLGLSLVQWYLLKKLVDMPATSPLALSVAVGVHPSTLTQTMKRLVKKEFIYISEDPKDSRKKQVTITRGGKMVLDDASIKIHEWSQDLVKLDGEIQRVRFCLESQFGIEEPRAEDRT